MLGTREGLAAAEVRKDLESRFKKVSELTKAFKYHLIQLRNTGDRIAFEKAVINIRIPEEEFKHAQEQPQPLYPDPLLLAHWDAQYQKEITSYQQDIDYMKKCQAIVRLMQRVRYKECQFSIEVDILLAQFPLDIPCFTALIERYKTEFSMASASHLHTRDDKLAHATPREPVAKFPRFLSSSPAPAPERGSVALLRSPAAPSPGRKA